MPRKTRKQKIAYQKRLKKDGLKAEEINKMKESKMKEMAELNKKFEDYNRERAVKLSIVEYEGDFYADVITTYLVKDGFLGFKRYEKISQIGTFYDKNVKSKDSIDDTINLIKKQLSTINKGYLFFEFVNTSPELKLKIVSGLEGVLCSSTHERDERKAKMTLPLEECPRGYKVDIVARRYVNDV